MVVTRRPHSTIPSQSVGIFEAELDGIGTYVVFEDISRDEGSVDARVFVVFEVDERVLRDTLMDSYVFMYLSAWVRNRSTMECLGKRLQHTFPSHNYCIEV